MSTLQPEIWAHICSFLYHPPPSPVRPGGSWRDLHQHDLTVVMRVNSVLHDAAAVHLYKHAQVANLPSFFSGYNTPSSRRSSKRDLLRLVKSLTLYNPRATSSRRQSSPNVFTIDPVYPFPDRKTLRIVDDTLDEFAKLSGALSTEEGLLPQLKEVTSLSLNTDKWEPIESYIMSAARHASEQHSEKRYNDYVATSMVFTYLIKQATFPGLKRWNLWPVSGPYKLAAAAFTDVQTENTVVTHYLSEYPTILPRVKQNILVLLRPMIVEQSFGRYLNWPDLVRRIRKITKGEPDMDVEVQCRLVASSRKLKDWDRIGGDASWELDVMDEMNDMVGAIGPYTVEDSSAQIRLTWKQDAVLAEQNERRGR